ncbi:MAG: FecR domain-containing protein [Odoribacteraceae bacterium]|jgi:ferric-dicitrate binding protein FerR (iron transport regulator)|nr:FecR domain-containing protein [Odoribacteraceae bacterium]
MRDLNDIIADLLAGEPLDKEEQDALARWINSEREESRVVTAREVLREGATARARFLDERESRFTGIRAGARARKRRRAILPWSVAAACALVAWGALTLVPSREPLPAPAEILPGSPRAELRLGNGQRIALSPGEKRTILDDSLVEIRNDENTLTYTPRADAGNDTRDTLVVPPGGEYILVLADGTRVFLNSSSRLTFSFSLAGDRREVELQGEAYFEVRADVARPFVVKAGEVTVEALGTSFNVNAGTTRRVVAMTLESGRVRVTAGEDSREATPGEQVLYDRQTGTLAARAVETELYTSWKDGYYLFRETPLEEIMETLSGWYNVNVIYMDERVKTTRFTGRLQRAGDIRYLLDRFAETGAISTSVEGNDVMIGKSTGNKEYIQ